MKKSSSVFERQLKALVKLNKTKTGRALVRDHREVFLEALGRGALRDVRRSR